MFLLSYESGFFMIPMPMGFGILFWILIVFVLYQAFKPSKRDLALKILDEKYIKGEIPKEKYLEMKREING
ncbi:MAG: hypothetical protein ACE5K0_12535 [Candidatus Methanofastidiosia archaeon]